MLRMETQGYPYLGLWHCCTSCWWGHPRFWRVTQNLPHCIHGSHRDPIRSSSTQAHPHFWYLKMKWIYTNSWTEIKILQATLTQSRLTRTYVSFSLTIKGLTTYNYKIETNKDNKNWKLLRINYFSMLPASIFHQKVSLQIFFSEK